MSGKVPEIVIVGAGFAGLNAAQRLSKYPVRITVVDRKNHHTFQPLLYQVATAGLSPGEIAAPIRGVLKKSPQMRVLMDEVAGFDLERKRVKLREGADLSYDYLVLAAGATHSYFGHPEWEQLAPGLKTIEDAIEIRRRVLLSFELAERRAAIRGKAEPIHIVVIGAGPTGVELAGTLAEIARRTIAYDFDYIDPRDTKILLLEGGPRVLPTYPEDLSRSAEFQLHKLGVEVMTHAAVTSIEPGYVKIGDRVLPSTVTLWAAGVAASPLGKQLGVLTDKAGRVIVDQDLGVPGHPEVFVLGDLANCKDPQSGKPLPGLAPVAIQQGRLVAKNIWHSIQGEPRDSFHYRDRGTMATIGRAAAVADLGRLHFSGFSAWTLWLFVHLMYLVGYRNRVLVMIEWAWSYLTYQRSARLVTGSTQLPGWEQPQRMQQDHQPSVEQVHEETSDAAD